MRWPAMRSLTLVSFESSGFHSTGWNVSGGADACGKRNPPRKVPVYHAPMRVVSAVEH